MVAEYIPSGSGRVYMWLNSGGDGRNANCTIYEWISQNIVKKHSVHRTKTSKSRITH